MIIRFYDNNDLSKFETFINQCLFDRYKKLFYQYCFSFSCVSSSLRRLKKLFRFRDKRFRFS